MRPLLLVSSFLILTTLAAAAPAPTKRNDLVSQPGAADMAGEWLMLWGDSEVPVQLTRRHDYRCHFQGLQYIGSWYWDERGRLLITEARSDPGGEGPAAEAFKTWTIRLQREKGKLNRRHLAGEVVLEDGRTMTFRLLRPGR
jgi:hypothetical protein